MAKTFHAGIGYTDDATGAIVSSVSRTLFADATLAPTEAIDSTALDTSGLDQIVVIIKNGNTTLTRAPQLIFLNEAGTEVHRIAPTAIAANTTVIYAIGLGATATGVTAGYSFGPSPKFQVTAAAPASGTGNGYVAIWGR